MPDDLPIYSEKATLRSGLQFADLARFSAVDTAAIQDRADRYIGLMEGAGSVDKAREVLSEPDKASLLLAHALLFAGTPGAGELRQSLIAGRYPGQDCPEPEYIDNSLNNFFQWMSAESMGEVHPIEKAALVVTRMIDMWPFASGNLTLAIMLANAYLKQAGLPPFFVLPEHMKEFDKVLAQAVKIETQPLVNAIHKTIKRELEAIAG